MAPESDNPIAEVAKSIPEITKGSSGAPELPTGSVVASDGSVVTLGEQGGSNTNLSSREK